MMFRQPLKVLYLNYHNSPSHQTWQGGDLSWGGSTHKITWPFDHFVWLGPVTYTLHLHLQKTYGHQTRQDESPGFKVTWPFDYVSKV